MIELTWDESFTRILKKGTVEKLFTHFGEQLNKNGYRAQKGQIIDASIIPYQAILVIIAYFLGN